MRLLTWLAVALFLCSCCKDSGVEVDGQATMHAIHSIASGKDLSLRNARTISRRIAGISNVTERVERTIRFAKMLYSIKIDALPYATQSLLMREMLWFGYHEQCGCTNLPVVAEWNVRLIALSWQRDQLRRLRPVRRVDVRGMDESDYVAYRRWQDCYNQCVAEYEKTVRWMKRALIPSVTESADVEIRRRLDSLVSSFDFGDGDTEKQEFHPENSKMTGPEKIIDVPETNDGCMTPGFGSPDYRGEWKRMRLRR